MKTMLRLLAVATSLSLAHAALAQAPAGSTGQCKDGTYTSSASKSGACRGHQGVKDWYAAAPAATTPAAKGAPAAPAAPAAAAATAKAAPAAAPAKAAAPSTSSASAPSGSTGACKDGTYTSAASKSGACRGHQGVKEWYAAASAPAAKAAPATAAAAAPVAAKPATPAPAPAAASAPAASGKMSPQAKAATMTQAPGGGAGMVWVNTDSKVYHCPGTTYYGKTKAGKYMSEADAKAMGAHADHNHPCTN